jgi:hypothetical protein
MRRIPTVINKGTVSVPARLKHLDRTQRHAVLATASLNRPHASLVAFARAGSSWPIVRDTNSNCEVSEHDRELPRFTGDRQSRKQQSGLSRSRGNHDFRQGTGSAAKKMRTEMAAIMSRKHQALEQFIDAPTTALTRVKIERCLHVGRFQSVTEWHG